jgi:1-acyl-sn-glycerol-3-phosphate acyltransferase
MNTTKSIALYHKLKALPLTLITYFLGLAIVIILFIPTFLVVLIPVRYRPEKLFFGLLYVIYTSILWATFVRIKVVNKSGVLKVPAIFVANHESALDIPLLGYLMQGRPHFWYIYERYTKLPVFGYFARQIGVTVTQRESSVDARTLVKGIKEVAEKKCSTLLFPEGGRFVDGTVHEFYAGFALIAKKLKQPVIPVYMKNPGRVYPPNSFFIYRHPITLTVGPEFYFEENDTNDRFVQRIHDWFDKQAH